ncbi:MAG TPA: PKD domain-containing protein [Puia sp.]|nr:PKD domain-containing protein [Puia sp.]
MNNRQIAYKRVDDKAIITMIVLAVLSLLVMAFRYANHTVCPSFNLAVRGNHYTTGEVIRFETNTRDARILHWSFGDNQSNDTKLPSAVHAYDEPGEYTVSLTVNGECTEYARVSIGPAPVVENPRLVPRFVYPQSAEVGKPVQFSDTTVGAQQWQWRFGETATVDATDKSPRYTYTTPGLKTVSVVINNDERQMGICKIYVNPPPPPKRKDHGGNDRPIIVVHDKPGQAPAGEQPSTAKTEPAPVKAPDITGPEFETQLRAVANKFKNAESFSAYFCGNLNTQVSLNGQMIPFTELCNKFGSLKNEKKIKKLTVQLVKNEQTNCIISMFVTLKEREGLFNKIF